MQIDQIISKLKKHYPDANCSLNHKCAFELLVATILSAQCTDERVNKVTPELFKKFPSVSAMAGGDLEEIKRLIYTTGFYNNKARNIKGACSRIMQHYGGQVPDTMQDLLTLPGVARKTANVVLGTWFKKAEGVVVDTHVKRISNLLGLTQSSNPEIIEKDLMMLVPREEWIWFSHALVFYGREVCPAKSHNHEKCWLG